MGVVMLHPGEGRRGPRPASGRSAGAVSGMQVAGDARGRMVEKLRVIGDGLAEFLETEPVIEIAEMMRQERLAGLGQADRALHLAAGGQRVGRILEPGGRGSVPGTRPRPRRRTIGPWGVTRSTLSSRRRRMSRSCITKASAKRRACARLVIADDLRLAREVAGGHHQRGRRAGRTEVMERRVGQHPAEPSPAGGEEVGQGAPCFSRRTMGAAGPCRRSSSSAVGAAWRRRIEPSGAISARGLAGRPLRVAQRGDGLRVRRIAGQVETADPLDREDAAFFQKKGAASSGSPGLFAPSRSSHRRGDRRRRRPRAGRGSGGRRGPRIPRGRRGTSRSRHGGLRPVIGQPVEDRQPRAAMGAIGEGIAMAPVRGSRISARQSGQVAASGVTRVSAPLPRLGDDGNPRPGCRRQSAGHARPHRPAQACRRLGRPARPETHPDRRRSRDQHAVCVVQHLAPHAHLLASCQTKGRKPTPCT
jgi:hypothetical protein